MTAASQSIQSYFDSIEQQVERVYSVAKRARAKGYDPMDTVEIPLARNLAERVEGLISAAAPKIKGSGMVERIFVLEKEFGVLDWRVALSIALEIAREKFCTFIDKREAMEVGIRVGIAYTTLGVVASPLEGFVRLELKKRRDGDEYFSLMYSGPIRSAGGTMAALSVVIADFIRKKMGYKEYDPSENEVKRMVTEIYDYHDKITNVQYLPSEEEIKFLVSHLPVQIDGDPSERFEVSNYKDLDRIATNRIRNGIVLVTAEGIAQKAPKIWKQLDKWGSDFELDHWKFLGKFVKLQKKMKARGIVEDDVRKLAPDNTYIKDLVAGRPVLTHPMRAGGFRLRYGRTRTSGLSSMSMHPATMYILDDYIATGTQLRYERPGKSSAMAPCDSIEGPIVKLKNGNVVMLSTVAAAQEHSKNIEEILFLGDFLANYGEFFNRAHKLVPAGYCEEWYVLEVKQALASKKIDYEQLEHDVIEMLQYPQKLITAKSAFKLSTLLDVPFHPRYTYHYKDISLKQFECLLDWLLLATVKRDVDGVVSIDLPLDNEKPESLLEDPKRVLELLGVPHSVTSSSCHINGDDAMALAVHFNLSDFDLTQENIVEIKKQIDTKQNGLDALNSFSQVRLRDKSGTYIGARMGRPEKAKMRRLTGNPQVLFPVGDAGGRMRSLNAAIAKGVIKAQFPTYYCSACSKETIYPCCEVCDARTKKQLYCRECNLTLDAPCTKHEKSVPYKNISLDISSYFNNALKKLKTRQYPDLIKGVRGTSNEGHTPENLMKALLRARHNLYVNKDGTIRYDMTEMPITHFKPREIGTSIVRLKALGYTHDMHNEELSRDDQLLEIKPQDLILPSCKEASDERADDLLYNVANFIDDSLVQMYGGEPFYKLKSKKDLVGHIVIGLAPHTSAAIVGRIIGFSQTQGCYAHPMWHSAQRRDCEGDENCVMLLADALINFSRHYLPAHRGATQDAPLVLTSLLIPGEVDDMVFDMDVVWSYPLAFYEAAESYKDPREVYIEQLAHRLNTEKQYEGFGFTHDVSDMNMGVLCSAYKTIPTMQDKVKGQMFIAEKIRAVDESDVARLVIERHFIRDIKGNLRKFTMQQFRCVDCNEKFRRPPLQGKCLKCYGKIVFTIGEGFVTKYLEPSIELAEKYELPNYLKLTLELTKRRIESVFGKEKDKQEGLVRWFS